MFIGPKILVLKRVFISSQLDSSRGDLFIIPALLISRFSPSLPTRALTRWAHSFMLQMSEISDGDFQLETAIVFKLDHTVQHSRSGWGVWG